MNESKIEFALRKINEKLVSSLDISERQDAFAQFNQLYAQQMSKAALKIKKTEKVHQNLKEKETYEENLKRQIQLSLKDRMELHFKKRENHQLQRIKNYQRMEIQWKDKLKAIGNQVKQQQKQNILLSNRLSKEALMFWQSKEEKTKSRVQNNKTSPRYFSNQYEDNHQETRFLTEADISQFQPKQQGHDKFNFPNIQTNLRMKTDNVGSRSVAVERQKSESIRQHLIKSNQLWKCKDDDNFQRVMQKLERIQKTRSRMKQMMVNASKLGKDNRHLKDYSTREEERYSTAKKIRHREKDIQSLSMEKPKRNHVKVERSSQPSKVGKRRGQIFDIQFKNRGQHFEQELKKQRRGEYRILVREAVKNLKLKVLKSP